MNSSPRISRRWFLVALLGVGVTAWAAEKKAAPGPNEPAPSTRSFFITGVTSESDVKAVSAAVLKVKSVTSVVDLTPTSGLANIAFDHHAVTHQQIAQAILDAGAYQVAFKFIVADYAKDGNAPKIDAVFARLAKLVTIEPLDKTRNLFVIRFLPFTATGVKPLGDGFNFGHIAHPIGDPAPKGLGLRIQQVNEGSLARPGAGKKKAKE